MAEAHALSGLELKQLSPVIGTEVQGIDLANVDDDTVAWLTDLLVERKVLFFRDQHISMEAHIAFAGRFGEGKIGEWP